MSSGDTRLLAAATLSESPAEVRRLEWPRLLADWPRETAAQELRLRLPRGFGPPAGLPETSAFLHLELEAPLDAGALQAWRPYLAGLTLLAPPHGDAQAMLLAVEAIGVAGLPLTVEIPGDCDADCLVRLAALDRRHAHLGALVIGRGERAPEALLALVRELRRLFHHEVRLVCGKDMERSLLPGLIEAGLDDLGDWGDAAARTRLAAQLGRALVQRLPLMPRHAPAALLWLAAPVAARALAAIDGEGFLRDSAWHTGVSPQPPAAQAARGPGRSGLARRLRRLMRGEAGSLAAGEIADLFAARGADAQAICTAADALRAQTVGEAVSYVVNRNINYTNICAYRCQFCAFAKGGRQSARDPAYRLELEEIVARVREARARGATEVCLQGGIHPEFSGATYENICAAVHAAEPGIHIHAFSPLEIWHGAATLDLDLDRYLRRLQGAGLRSLPGTAAEILVDAVRAVICPDKLDTAQWCQVMEAAARVGLRATATIMFGHVEGYGHWAEHLLLVRELQRRTGVFTEFVPLPFVAQEAPMFRRGRARAGPSFREALLMHAVARLVLHPLIPNIQASWVKMGPRGAQRCLQAGANDFGGVLMDESITRAAGASHGRQMTVAAIHGLIREIGRRPLQRNTFYQAVPLDLPAVAASAPLCTA